MLVMSSGLLVMSGAYLVRIIVLRKIGVAAAGFYQAAWAFGGLYVGFILTAMGTDFYPRLTAAVTGNNN
jgi:enterobacterial common antigen flippase